LGDLDAGGIAAQGIAAIGSDDARDAVLRDAIQQCLRQLN